MTDTITPLVQLSSDDVLDDLKRRVEQMENSDAGGYDACIEFYKRIIARIELADEVAMEGWSRMRYSLKAVNDGEQGYELNKRLFENTEYLDKRLKELGEDE